MDLNFQCQINEFGDIHSSLGFYEFYFENLKYYPDRKSTFDFCNAFFKNQYGFYRYRNWDAFFGMSNNGSEIAAFVPVREKTLGEKQRDYLLTYFKNKGFDSWVSFKPLILCHFPEVDPAVLLLFYNGKSLDKEVLKYVDFTRQIIGP